ncbi:MAG: DMT family transporter [Clostridiales bacterium]|nr:DMT family transporter [Clostridiales bacterium]
MMGKKLGAFLLVVFFAVCITLFINMIPELLVLMNSYQLAFWISIFIFVPMNIVYLFLYAFKIRNKSTGSIIMTFGASVFLYGGLFLFAMSVARIGLNSSLSLVFLAPIFFLILAPLLSKESINGAQILAVIITTVGGACIFYARGLIHPTSWETISYIIGASACWTGFSLLALKTKTGIFVNVYIYVLVGVITATIFMFVQSSIILPAYSSVGTLLIFAALVATSIYLWAGTFRYSSISYWSAMVFIIPSVMILYEVIFNSASLPLFGIIGLGITGFGVIYRMIIKM